MPRKVMYTFCEYIKSRDIGENQWVFYYNQGKIQIYVRKYDIRVVIIQTDQSVHKIIFVPLNAYVTPPIVGCCIVLLLWMFINIMLHYAELLDGVNMVYNSISVQCGIKCTVSSNIYTSFHLYLLHQKPD